MDAYVLPSTTYVPGRTLNQYAFPSAQQQRQTFNTIIDDESNYSSDEEEPLAELVKRTLVMSMSPQSDNFPTPKASLQTTSQPASPAPWVKSRSDPEFDDLYDVTDDEGSEIVPLTVSESLRKHEKTKKSRYPSIVIPSPSAWPTIQKLQQKSAGASSIPPTPPSKVAPSPAILSMIAERRLTVPDRSTTPSLDGSLTSEEMDKLSCPSTPDSRTRQDDDNWDGTIQLNPQAMATLHHISGNEVEEINPVIEVGTQEMQEVVGGTRQLSILNTTVAPIQNEEDILSALSVPSPGGFFSSLGSSARHTWSFPKIDETPNTSTAENFYGVPWLDTSKSAVVEHVVEIVQSPSSMPSSAPSTARLASTKEAAVTNPYEYNENYEKELAEMSSTNIDRTSVWIRAQETYLAAVRSPDSETRPAIHDRKDSGAASIDEITSPSKKSVRFADEPIKTPSSIGEVLSGKETTYLQKFEDLSENSFQVDAFVHGQARAEAIHLERRCLTKSHKNQLTGRFELIAPTRASPKRPISHFYQDEDIEQNRAQKERQAVEQIQPTIWNLHALKALHGGQLISNAAAKWLCRPASTPIRILDIGGQPTCDWAWQVALDFPHASVYNVITKDQQSTETSDMASPDNYHSMTVPNLWTLPFPAGHFDVISARSLHALLKVHRPAPSTANPTSKQITGDEYDLCLREAQRVLKKGGYLEYALLDAEVIHDTGLHSETSSPMTARTGSTTSSTASSRAAPSRAQALGTEFAFNLRTRGYDPQPTKKFVPRLRRAGFQGVKRAWMVLPMPATVAIAKPSPFEAPRPSLDSLDAILAAASEEPERSISPEGDISEIVIGSTADASVVAGLVGARAWESWMLKLEKEMGKEESRLLDGVAAAMEEGAAGLAGWRYLTGWARKAW